MAIQSTSSLDTGQGCSLPPPNTKEFKQGGGPFLCSGMIVMLLLNQLFNLITLLMYLIPILAHGDYNYLAHLVVSLPPTGVGFLMATQNVMSAGQVGIPYPPGPAAGVTSSKMHLTGQPTSRVAPPAVPAGSPPLPRSPPQLLWLHLVPGPSAHTTCPTPLLLIRHPDHDLSLKNIIGGFRVVTGTWSGGCGAGNGWVFSFPPPNTQEFKLGGGPSCSPGTPSHDSYSVSNSLSISMFSTIYWTEECMMPTFSRSTCLWSEHSILDSSLYNFNNGRVPMSIVRGLINLICQVQGPTTEMILSSSFLACCLTGFLDSFLVSIISSSIHASSVRRLTGEVGDQLTRLSNTFSVVVTPFAIKWSAVSTARTAWHPSKVSIQSSPCPSSTSGLSHPPSLCYLSGSEQRHLLKGYAAPSPPKVVFNQSGIHLANGAHVYHHHAAHHFPTYKLLNKAKHALNGNRHRLGIKACSWNCNRGLLDEHGHATAKVAEINNFLLSHSVNLMAVIEAGIHGANSLTIRRTPMTDTSIHRELSIPGYKILLPDTWHAYGTARILLYVMLDIHAKVISTPTQITDLPIVSVTAKRGAEAKTIFNFFYREFTGGVSGLRTAESQVDRLTRMLAHWSELDALGFDMVTLGDMNLCYTKWTELGCQSQALIDLVKASQLTCTLEQLVNVTTRSQLIGDDVITSTIDHVYTNCGDRLTEPEVIPVGDSDHLGIVVCKIINTLAPAPQSIRLRDYKNAEIPALLNDVASQGINELIMSITDLDEAASTFKREVGFYLTKYAPVKVMTLKKSNKPFVSDETKDLISKKRSAWLQFKHTRDPLAHARFKSLAKSVKAAINANRNTWLSKDLDSGSTTKQSWAKAKLLLGQDRSPSPKTINSNTGPVTDPKRIADLFASHYINKYSTLRSGCTMEPSKCPVDRVSEWLESRGMSPPPLILKPVDELKIVTALAKLKPGKMLPSDDIDGHGLLLVAPLLLPAIQHIVNLSITTGTFASVWKEQVIHPHHKKEDKDCLDNYRPVSDTVKLGLLTEHIVHEQLTAHFHLHNLFHSNHHGSLASHDTATALIQANTFCLEAAEAKKLAATLLIDQTAAFDLVDQSILMGKLEVYGCTSNTKSWFQSYLADRGLRVQVGSVRSHKVALGPYGVPKGSVLGSTIYVISENDLPSASSESSTEQTIAYVDDTSDQVAADTPDELMAKLQMRADNVAFWLKDNRIILLRQKLSSSSQLTLDSGMPELSTPSLLSCSVIPRSVPLLVSGCWELPSAKKCPGCPIFGEKLGGERETNRS